MFITVPVSPMAVGTPHELNIEIRRAKSLGGGATHAITMAPMSFIIACRTPIPGV